MGLMYGYGYVYEGLINEQMKVNVRKGVRCSCVPGVRG